MRKINVERSKREKKYHEEKTVNQRGGVKSDKWRRGWNYTDGNEVPYCT